MTTLITADLHLSDNPRDSYRHEFLRGLPDVVRPLGVRRVLILGDLTEEKDRFSARLVNQVADHIRALAEVCSVHILKGNHDYLSEDAPFFQFLSHIPSVFYYSEPTERRLRGLGTCMFLPHSPRPNEELAGWVGHQDWFFAHQTFEGAEAGRGRKLGGVSAGDLFTGDCRVISGDVHVPQDLGPVTYVGAPYSVDFGDDYEPRVLLVDGTNIDSHPCPGPQKRVVTMERLTELPASWDKSGVREGDIVRVVVNLQQGDLGDIHTMRQEIQSWGDDAGVRLYIRFTQPESAHLYSKEGRELSRRSDEELVQAYARQQDADRVTLRAGMRYLEE